MGERTRPDWTFLTNHSHLLVCIAEEPDVRGRDIAERVGITGRAAQSIIGDLVDAGYVTRTREGRRNRYTINADGHLRHPLQEPHRRRAARRPRPTPPPAPMHGLNPKD